LVCHKASSGVCYEEAEELPMLGVGGLLLAG